jgi:hypothetical protein
MYEPSQRRFVFRVRLDKGGLQREGLSRRYTAITLIGLASEELRDVGDVLQGDDVMAVVDGLLAELPAVGGLGDVALTLWAAIAIGHANWGCALERLTQLADRLDQAPTVEVAWSLAALCHGLGGGAARSLRERLARGLLAALQSRSDLFPHRVRGTAGLRGHVACFADQVYPIHALAGYHRISRQREALDVAERCADRICRLQGPAGQWWWHYDVRTGRVIEGYPVYAVHQDAMAPMALFALGQAGGTCHYDALRRGLGWLAACPELGSGTLIDAERGVIWRKVARREPRKLVRGVQSLAARVHPALRLPGTALLFPPVTIDWECRPYHLGWLLYAWPAIRAAAWDRGLEPA